MDQGKGRLLEHGSRRGEKEEGRGATILREISGPLLVGCLAVPVLARLLLGTPAAEVKKLWRLIVYCVLVVSEENILVADISMLHSFDSTQCSYVVNMLNSQHCLPGRRDGGMQLSSDASHHPPFLVKNRPPSRTFSLFSQSVILPFSVFFHHYVFHLLTPHFSDILCFPSLPPSG